MPKLKMPSVEQVRQLPAVYTYVVPSDWEDINGHVNVQYYLKLYEQSGWPLMNSLGLDLETKTTQFGVFDLEHHLSFQTEIHVGNTVSVHHRGLQRSEKLFHGMVFIVNDTRDELACTIEYVSTGADLKRRRSAPLIGSLAEGLDRSVAESEHLTWPAPVCGVISV